MAVFSFPILNLAEILIGMYVVKANADFIDESLSWNYGRFWLRELYFDQGMLMYLTPYFVKLIGSTAYASYVFATN